MRAPFPGENPRNRTEARFPQTSTQVQLSVEALCAAYWEPIYAFIRKLGKQPHDAEDLTQRFLIHFLEKNRLAGVKRGNGKFRSYLMRAIKNFLIDDWRTKPAPERKGLVLPFEIDSEQGELALKREPVDKLDPEKLFERVWAAKVLEKAMSTLRGRYHEDGKAELFELTYSFLPGCEPRCSRAEAAKRLGMTLNAFDTSLHRLKRRFRECLLHEVAGTLPSPTAAEIDEELAALIGSFG